MQPQDIATASREQLVERYMELGVKAEEIEAEKLVLREEILEQLKDNGEVIGHYTVTRVERLSFPGITLEQAKELGAVKEQKDEAVLKQLYLKGVKLPAEPNVCRYPLIKEIQSKE